MIAPLHVEPVATGVQSPVVARRFVAYRPAPGTVTVSYGDGSTRSFAVAADCDPRFADGHSVLVDCDRASQMLDVRSGALAAVSTAKPSDELYGFGRFWYVGLDCSPQPNQCGPFRQNRVTGERVSGSYDPNFADLRPYAIRRFPRFARQKPLVLSLSARRRVRLSICPAGCESATFSRQTVAWIEGRRLIVTDGRGKHRRVADIPAAPYPLMRDLRFQGDQNLILTVPTGDGHDLYRIAL